MKKKPDLETKKPEVLVTSTRSESEGWSTTTPNRAKGSSIGKTTDMWALGLLRTTLTLTDSAG